MDDTNPGLYIVDDCLIVPVAADLDEDSLTRLKLAVLDHLDSTRIRGVLINVSAVSILGSFGFSILRDTARSVKMMGATAVFVGFRPGVAAALVDFDADVSELLTAVTTKDAFALLKGR